MGRRNGREIAGVGVVSSPRNPAWRTYWAKIVRRSSPRDAKMVAMQHQLSIVGGKSVHYLNFYIKNHYNGREMWKPMIPTN